MTLEVTATENNPALQENSASTPEDDAMDIAQAPSLEEKNAYLHKRISELEPVLSEAQQSNSKLRVALGLSERRSEQLEANIKAIRIQRDLFMEREADALVDKTLLEKQSERNNKEAESRIDDIHSKYKPLNSRLNQVTNSLTEIRDKFGIVKHDLKVCEEEKQAIGHNYYRQLDKYNTLENALAWYVEHTAGIKYSVPYRFEKAMNTPLTPQHIVIAFEAHRSGSAKRMSQGAFVEFIIRSVRSSINKEKGYTEI